MQISPKMPQRATFHHFNGRSTSRIDLFVESKQASIISSISIDSRNAINLSPHDLVTATIPASLVQPTARVSKAPAPPARVRWDKTDKMKYMDLTELRLKILASHLEGMPAEVITDRLNDILVKSAVESCPPPPKKRKGTRYRWNPKLKEIIKDLKSKRYMLNQLDPNNRKHSEQNAAYIAAKRLLRRAQRQAAAKRQQDIKQGIMDACAKANKEEFHRSIKRQKQSKHKTSTVNFGPHEVEGKPEESWAKYFKHLATPVDDQSFNDEYERHLDIMYLLQALTSNGDTLDPVSTTEVRKILSSLKNGKAPDIYGVSTEHIKLAHPTIIEIICHLTNATLKSGKLPDSFKLGSIAPVVKKKKSHKNPNSYRRITITSIIGKIVEKHMIAQARPILDPKQSHLQFGFSVGCSPMFAALIITEIMADAKDTKEPLFLTFLDTSKAFDVVHHKGMLNALHEQGVQGSLWKLFDSMYTGIKSAVKWDGQLSSPFEEEQGIRQGGPSSSDNYKAGKNKPLKQLDNNPTLKIGHLNVGAIMVADDLAVGSRTAIDMQQALHIAENDASKERYRYNTDKTKTIHLNCKDPPTFHLNNEKLGTSEKEVHLGITRNSKNNNSDTIEERIKSARQAAYKLMGAGLHGLNGVGPDVALEEYRTYVMPILTYGLEALVLERNELEALNTHLRKNLRYIQHLPQSTAVPAIHLLTGMPPMEAIIDIKTLCFFRNIADCNHASPPSKFINELIWRQLAMKQGDSASWAVHVKEITRKYSLPTAHEVFMNPPRKQAWKSMVKEAVYRYWTERLQDQAQQMTTLQLLNIQSCVMGRLHSVWSDLPNPLAVQKATTKALLLVMRYPIASSRTAGAQRRDVCPLCKTEAETTAHFLLQCSALSHIRIPYLIRIMQYAQKHQISVDPDSLTRAILDSTYMREGPEYEDLCRNFVFKMHHQRSKILGGSTKYIGARKS